LVENCAIYHNTCFRWDVIIPWKYWWFHVFLCQSSRWWSLSWKYL